MYVRNAPYTVGIKCINMETSNRMVTYIPNGLHAFNKSVRSHVIHLNLFLLLSCDPLHISQSATFSPRGKPNAEWKWKLCCKALPTSRALSKAGRQHWQCSLEIMGTMSCYENIGSTQYSDYFSENSEKWKGLLWHTSDNLEGDALLISTSCCWYLLWLKRRRKMIQ